MEGAIGGRRLLFSSKQPPGLLTLDKNGRSGQAPPRSVDEPQPFLHILRAVLRRKRLIFAMAALGGLLAALIGFLTPPFYVATAQIVIDVRPFDMAAGTNQPQGAEEAVIDTHVTVLSSDAHLRRVVAALHASGDAAPTAAPTPDVDSFSARARANLSRMWTTATRPFRRTGENTSTEAADIAETAALKRNLRVGQERRSRIVNVVFASPDSARAAVVANAVAQLYIEDLSQRRRGDAERIATWLSKRLPEIRQEVANAEEKLEAYRLVYGVGASGAPDETGQQIAQMSRQLALSRFDAATTAERFKRADELRRTKAPTTALAEALGSSALIELAKRERSGDAMVDRTEISQAIELETDASLMRLDNESRIYQAQVKAIEDRLQLLKGAARETALGFSGLRALERQASATAQIYDALLRRQQEITEQVQFAAPDARVLALAWTPERPSSLNPLLLIPPSAIIFGLFGVLIAIGVDLFDRTLRGERETAEALETPCVGVTPKIASHHASRIHDLPRRQLGAAYAQSIRSLLASVLNLNAGDHMPRTVLVTSSGGGEGKTTLAYSLAIFVARLRWRVLLLDFGRHASPVTRDFRASFDANGATLNLTDVLQQGRPITEAVKHLREIEVDYVPPPKPDGDLLKLLASPQASQLLEQFSDCYDLIIIDGPALLDGPEASILAKLVDQVLLAVHWGATTRGAARLALERLNSDETFDPDGRPRVACVLTQVDLKLHAGYGFEDSGDVLARGLS